MYAEWILIGSIIITVLGLYAGNLLFKLHKQKQLIALQQEQKKDKANAKKAKVLADIRYIAIAMLDNRCELSEGVVRIASLFGVLSMTEQTMPSYPALYAHFDLIKTHPIMEKRSALTKQDRMKLDFIRMKSESNLESQILEEIKQLTTFH